MKRLIAILLACSMLLTSCASQDIVKDNSGTTTQVEAHTVAPETYAEDTLPVEENTAETTFIDRSKEIENLGFTTLDDADLMRYVEDSVYIDLVTQLDNEDYFVENVSAVYISKEYLDELEYNSQANIFFGYTLAELEEMFEGTKYIFTLGDDGTTTVQEFEEYDDTYARIVKNVAIGTGVILLCVTVSTVSNAVGAPAAITAIFAASAKAGTTFALSSGTFSFVTTAIIKGFQTKDFGEALKAAALSGSEGFMWAAISGSLIGGAGEAIALKGATISGLTMNEAAQIQLETKMPLDVITQIHSMEEYNIYKEIGFTTEVVNGKLALIRDIDLDYVGADGLTNLQRMLSGNAPLDPTGVAYELHHIGQHADSTLAILTQAEHRMEGNYSILHILGNESEIDRVEFAIIRESFWKTIGSLAA